MSRAYGPEEASKLNKLINEGSVVLREIDDLKEGLADTTKAVAEELGIKPSIISRAIKLAHSGKWNQVNEEFEEVEAILDITKNI